MEHEIQHVIDDYKSFYGFNKFPFSINQNTEFTVNLSDQRRALDMLIFAIYSGECISKITGKIGIGKTFLCQRLKESIKNEYNIIEISNKITSTHDFYTTIGKCLNIFFIKKNEADLFIQIKNRLRSLLKNGYRTVLCIDEAQLMPDEILINIFLMSNLEYNNKKLIQVVLLGQPELDKRLQIKKFHPLLQRIGFSYHLEPLDLNNIKKYIDCRLKISGYAGKDLINKDAVRYLKRKSIGSLRLINLICHRSLLVAYSEGMNKVLKSHVQYAIYGNSRKTGYIFSVELISLLISYITMGILL